MGTTVRNDHVSICNMKEQVVIGEMIKSILNHKYEGKHFSAEYREVEAEKLELVLDWFVVEERGRVSLFMMSEFRIIVKLDSENDNIIIMELHKIIGGLISMLNRYFDNKLLDERRIMPNRAESIVSRIIEARSGVNNNSSINIKSSPKSYVEPVKQKPELEMKSEINSNEKSNTEITPIISESEKPESLTHTEEIVPEVDSDLFTPNSEQSELNARTKKLALSLNHFFFHLLKTEKKYQSPSMVESNGLFFYGKPENNMQVICCKDGFTALNLKFAISWHIADAYDTELSIFAKEDNVYLDDSFLYGKNKKEKRQKNGTFCFAPNAGTTLDDMGKRLRKVNYMFNSAFEKVDDCFRVMYLTSRSAETSGRILSSMGWSVKVEGSTLVIFTEFNPVTSIVEAQKKNNPKKEITKIAKVKKSENKEIPKNGKESFVFEKKETSKHEEEIPKTSLVSELSKVHLILSPICKFAGSKKEGIEKLQKIYLNQALFLAFSPDNQKKITDLLQKNWIDEHPEEYAMSIVEFLENN